MMSETSDAAVSDIAERLFLYLSRLACSSITRTRSSVKWRLAWSMCAVWSSWPRSLYFNIYRGRYTDRPLSLGLDKFSFFLHLFCSSFLLTVIPILLCILSILPSLLLIILSF